MAIRVPTPSIQGAQALGGTQAQAADTPFQTLRMPDTAFNARLLSQLGGDMTRLGEYMQEQEDERLLLEFQAGLGEWERQTLYGELPDGTGTATGGMLGLEGEAAFGMTDRLANDFDTFLSEFNPRLTGLSRSGQLAAQRYAQSRRETLLDQATRQEVAARAAYNQRLRAQALAAAQGAAAFAWSSDESLAAAEANVRSSAVNAITPEVLTEEAYTAADSAVEGGFVGAYARGDAAEASAVAIVEERVAAEVDAFYRQTIRTALLEGSSTSVRRAREIFTQATERGALRLSGDDDLILRDVRFGEERDVSMSIATEMYAQFPDDIGSAIQAVRDMRVPGEQEYYIIEELQRRYDQEADAARQRREQSFQSLLEDAQAGRMSPTDPRLADLSAEQVAQLDRTNQGLPLVSDPLTLNWLRSMYGRPDELATIELQEIYGSLTEEQYRRWEGRILEARETVAGRTPPGFVGARTESATIDRAIEGLLGLDTSTNAPADVQRQVALVYELFEQEGARRQAAGEPWTTAEVNRFADELMLPQAAPRFGDGIPLYQLLIGEGFDPYGRRVGDVPADRANEILVELGQLRQPLTEDTIGAVYDGVPPVEIGSIIAVLDARGAPATRENIVAIYRAARGGD